MDNLDGSLPFEKANGSQSKLEVQTRAEGLEYNDMIAEWIIPDIPNLCKVLDRYPQWTLSKAFSASRARNTLGSLVTSAKCSRLSILLVPSGACLPFTKPT